MIYDLVINGTSLAQYGVMFDASASMVKPVRKTRQYSIPGRNGMITEDDGDIFENVIVPYHGFIRSGFKANFSDLAAFLHHLSGYNRIECGFDVDHFRLGTVITGIDPAVNSFIRTGSLDLKFDCMPQRFLKSGETAQTFSADGTITNPTLYASEPLIRIYGSGSVTIGEYTITTSGSEAYTDIDCHLMECYNGSTRLNEYVQFSTWDYPKLKSGSNGIDLGSGITKVEITPRWWTI